jgi:hypothetical protein
MESVLIEENGASTLMKFPFLISERRIKHLNNVEKKFFDIFLLTGVFI